MDLIEGDKVKSTGTFGQNIQAGKTFTIAELKKGTFLFADKIIMKDEHGKKPHLPRKLRTPSNTITVRRLVIALTKINRFSRY
ncbi:MAG: hypothetical protein ACL7BU_06345 [Candidatus Phlomobacter fragariae]